MTAQPKLTPAQVAVLRELAKPNRQAWLSSDHIRHTVSWRIAGRSRHVTSTVKSLVKCGLLESPSGVTATISEQARAFIAQLDAQE